MEFSVLGAAHIASLEELAVACSDSGMEMLNRTKN